MTKHGTVLLIADNADEVLSIRKAFAEVEMVSPLQTVNSFKDALAYFNGDGVYADRAGYPIPFLVLLDLSMADENGFAVLRWLFDRPGLRKKFTVVALNRPGSEPDIQLAYELGAQSYLVKPGDYKQLLAALRRVKEYWIELNRQPGDAG
jgi:DNA-binding response OmpR family regulator